MDVIHFFTEDIDFTLPAPTATAAWLRQVVRQEGYAVAQLNVIFCSDRCLHAYNLQYLQHDTLTDVLAFDYSDAPGIVEGDVYISVERVQENALTWRQPWLQELHTVMVHGVLHLLGYDDRTPAAQALMRQQEAAYIAQGPIVPI
ncbi:MAG: rRNA maturation RNase YbeY [Bacteroidota bacterium]